MKKRLRIAVLLLMLALTVASCAPKELPNASFTTVAPTETEATCPAAYPLSVFQLIRADHCSEEITRAAVRLNRTIKEYLGSSLPIYIDMLTSKESPCEILIGDTSRAETQAVLASLEKGDFVVRSVPTENGVKLVVCGTDDDLTLRALTQLETCIANAAVEENGQLKHFDLKTNYYDLYSDFTLEVGEPILVAQGDTYAELGWGPYQFPNLFYTTAGSIICNWHTSNDKIYGGVTFDIPSGAVSDDGGLTWREKTSADKLSYESRALMQNGKYFAGFVGKGAYEADYPDRYYSVYTCANGSELYYGSILKELDKTFYAQEYDPVSKTTTKFECTVNWPNMLVAVHNGNVVYPPQKQLAIAGGLGDLATDDALYFCTYGHSTDPVTGKPGKYSGYYSVLVFRSTDNARTWDLISEIPVTDEIYEESKNHTGVFEGFDEPMMEQMPDGSIVMLIRTGSNQPCYLVRSTNGCKTWSTPVKFDEVGVRPFIINLDCGVTLSSYGRTGLFLRATSDPAGLEWNDPIEITFNRFGGGDKSCYYTYFLPLDQDRVLWVYTDFYYTPTGIVTECGKSVVARIITVKPNTA